MTTILWSSGADHTRPCGCRIFGDTGQLAMCEQHRASACQRCRRDGWDGVILADSEDWRKPVCADCFEEVGGDADWDLVSP